MTELAGKVALVTGGSRGLGEFIAAAFVRAGAKVYISSRKAKVCDALASELSAHGQCISLPFDLATIDGVKSLANEFNEREAKLHILVNNAGATWGAPLEEFPESGWDRVMDLNVKSVFFLTQQLLPALRRAATNADPARVINIGSIAGTHTGRTNTNYSYIASKSAVHHITRMLAGQLGPDNITVNALAPGPFNTKMMEFALNDPVARGRIEAAIPLGRVGEEEDIAGAALFLCQRAGAYISGAVIPLDGGAAASR